MLVADTTVSRGRATPKALLALGIRPSRLRQQRLSELAARIPLNLRRLSVYHLRDRALSIEGKGVAGLYFGGSWLDEGSGVFSFRR